MIAASNWRVANRTVVANTVHALAGDTIRVHRACLTHMRVDLAGAVDAAAVDARLIRGVTGVTGVARDYAGVGRTNETIGTVRVAVTFDPRETWVRAHRGVAD